MKHNTTIHSVLALFILGLLAAIINPGMFWMPSMVHMSMTIILLVLVALFGVFVWNEQSRDEREELHKHMVGRVAYLVGTAVLVVGIVAQHMSHIPTDPWLVLALGAMILTKLVGLVLLHKK
ncbi:MAG: hypothetical protein COU33_01435 [Candidatus Magasanikbacteria bacterium CG10_big_fil_rev_8_21_14_0_10_43_6]|uniref:DUF2178 domain-containing protein n=1 Tax=Candidatus Magasanikbacteria bacterium CG10_big_fil_rev_8_21_14_0_10_43_6 TaxID=1974650 RepID=A0A2M6W1T0_9BACT|nr:MAG: hypothetical protein COU33_01435 [Candidatus Magasanikbacteria bacterium CG10_big_fil_rev_8_21_14_0_10_43_6]